MIKLQMDTRFACVRLSLAVCFGRGKDNENYNVRAPGAGKGTQAQ